MKVEVVRKLTFQPTTKMFVAKAYAKNPPNVVPISVIRTQNGALIESFMGPTVPKQWSIMAKNGEEVVTYTTHIAYDFSSSWGEDS